MITFQWWRGCCPGHAGVASNSHSEQAHLNEPFSAALTSSALDLRHSLRSALFLHPQHPFHGIVGAEHRIESLDRNHGNGSLPKQWLSTTVTAALGKPSIDSCRTTVFSFAGLQKCTTLWFYEPRDSKCLTPGTCFIRKKCPSISFSMWYNLQPVQTTV